MKNKVTLLILMLLTFFFQSVNAQDMGDKRTIFSVIHIKAIAGWDGCQKQEEIKRDTFIPPPGWVMYRYVTEGKWESDEDHSVNVVEGGGRHTTLKDSCLIANAAIYAYNNLEETNLATGMARHYNRIMGYDTLCHLHNNMLVAEVKAEGKGSCQNPVADTTAVNVRVFMVYVGLEDEIEETVRFYLTEWEYDYDEFKAISDATKEDEERQAEIMLLFHKFRKSWMCTGF